MKKRIKPILLTVLTVIVLTAVLSACGGGGSKAISDGYYEPEGNGNYEGIKFNNGEVTFYFSGIPGEYAKAYAYTYKKDSKLGWVLNYDNTQLQVEIIDEKTIEFSNGERYVRE